MKIFRIAVSVVAAAIAAVLAYAATQPDRFEVQRSTSIRASAERIFPFINDLRTFNTWNPFDKKDPNVKGTYSGPESGKGAAYAFESSQAGTGRLEIADAAPPSRVTMRLTMIKPLAADNRVQFILQPQGDMTRVTWAMDGDVPFVGKLIHLFVDMDRMVGQEFANGLAELKVKAER
ncbi:MAG: SRPBCC family protein [Xanthobacteraceae bacterium]|jgi:Polyketide cyclase / dehydrase and lipid transport